MRFTSTQDTRLQLFHLLQSTAGFTPLQQLLPHVDTCWHLILVLLLHFDQLNHDRNCHLAEHDLVVVRRVKVHLQEVAETLAQVVVLCCRGVKVEDDQRS